MRVFVYASIALLVCCGGLYSKEHRLSYDEDQEVYSLIFDDTRISVADLQKIACLSPYVSYCGPIQSGGSSMMVNGKRIIDKLFMAPMLEGCAGQTCARDLNLPDDAFFKDAASNLDRGDRQVEILRGEQVPPVLQPIKTYLLNSLEDSLEREKAKYQYLKSGNLEPMRQLLCGVCDCASEEDLFKLLGATRDPRRKLEIARYQWQNEVVRCERCRQLTTYPMDTWARFLKEYCIVERHRFKHID